MSKANQKAIKKATQKEQEAIIEANFTNTITSLDSISDHLQRTMPEVSQSLRLTISIIKLYQRAYYVTRDNNKRT